MSIEKYSNPAKVRAAFNRYKGSDDATLSLSTRKDKKYMVKHDGKTTHFGAANMEDFTKNNDADRRKNYLARSGGIGGNWKKDKYSANNLARHLLWAA